MSKTVMIVEDNELNMKLFHDLLEAYGYRTIGPRHGFEVLDLARNRRPDLILMDIQLPEVSGLEVTKWLKEDPDLQAIPVVAVSAFAMGGDEERIREGGCQAYLSKPISVPKFIETIRRFLGVGHDVAVGPSGEVWYAGQNLGIAGRLNPASGEIERISLGQNSEPHGGVVRPVR